MDIGNSGAVIPVSGVGIEGENVGEESLGKLSIKRALGHKFFKSLTFYLANTKWVSYAILKGRR